MMTEEKLELVVDECFDEDFAWYFKAEQFCCMVNDVLREYDNCMYIGDWIEGGGVSIYFIEHGKPYQSLVYSSMRSVWEEYVTLWEKSREGASEVVEYIHQNWRGPGFDFDSGDEVLPELKVSLEEINSLFIVALYSLDIQKLCGEDVCPLRGSVSGNYYLTAVSQDSNGCFIHKVWSCSSVADLVGTVRKYYKECFLNRGRASDN